MDEDCIFEENLVVVSFIPKPDDQMSSIYGADEEVFLEFEALG